MKTFILIVAIAILSQLTTFSQGCLPEGITFTTQEQIDNFQTDYPGCTEIEGDVCIGVDNPDSTNISNLNGLSVVTTIGGYLSIENNTLTNLSGLENLSSIGNYFNIDYNDVLINLIGLENLSSISGALRIRNNDALTNLTALENLNYIGGELRIDHNDALTNLTGLENITSIGGNLFIGGNYGMTSLTGLENLVSVGGTLTSIANSLITDMMGLVSLTSVGGNLEICGHVSLNSLTGLENLNFIGEALTIGFNDSLTDIEGIENIQPSSIVNIFIYYNTVLSECDVQCICDFLANPNGTISIGYNASGCNSPEEVEEACLTHSCLPEGITFTTQEQIDNFQSNYPGCTEIEGNVIINGIDITGLDGLNVITSIGGSLKILMNMNLTSLTGLDSLSSIGIDIEIMNNYALTSTTGLENLTSVPEDLWIENNPVLNDLNGLSNITCVGELLYIWGNPLLSNLDDLGNLISVESIGIIYNNQLSSIGGLLNVNSSISALSIHGNQILSNLSGLQNIQSGSIYSLYLTENPLLSECDIQGICEYLAAPGGTIEIHDNAPGCNSPEEVQQACLTSVKENILQEEITLFPNPASSFITIIVPGEVPVKEAIIYNHLGQEVLSAKPENNTVDVAGLKAGMYMIEVKTKEFTGRQKMIKQ
jgi:hypothetical protein